LEVLPCVQILVKSYWFKRTALIRIHRQKSSTQWIHVTSAQVVETQIRVELFARVEVVVWCRTGSIDQVAEGVIVVSVGDRGCGISELANRTVAVVIVER
jgi:hypothetical protein